MRIFKLEASVTYRLEARLASVFGHLQRRRIDRIADFPARLAAEQGRHVKAFVSNA